jgi:hypothetical protein
LKIPKNIKPAPPRKFNPQPEATEAAIERGLNFRRAHFQIEGQSQMAHGPFCFCISAISSELNV